MPTEYTRASRSCKQLKPSVAPHYQTVEGVLHYCVANRPGAVPRISTFALTNATLPYTLKLVNKGFLDAIGSDPGLKGSDPGLKEGVNTYAGHCTYQAVAEAQGLAYRGIDALVEGATISPVKVMSDES